MTKTTAVYIMGFTPETMNNNNLVRLVRTAESKLQAQNPAFKQAMRQANSSQAQMNIDNQLFDPVTQTPQIMQEALGGWVQTEAVPFQPVSDDNFFINDLRDEEGRGNYILFYFHRVS
jgi:hypothetical protein